MSSFLTQDQVADKVFLVVVPARLLSAELCRRREGLTTQQVQSCCQSLSPPSVLRGPGSCGQAGPHASQVHVVDPFLRALHPSALSGAALAYTGGRLPTSTPPPTAAPGREQRACALRTGGARTAQVRPRTDLSGHGSL